MVSQEYLAIERKIQARKIEFKNEILKIVAENNEPDSLACALIDRIFQAYIDSNTDESQVLEILQVKVSNMLSRCYLRP